MIKYNLEFLLKIKIEDVKPIRGYKFIPSKKYFFGIYSTEPKFVGDYKETMYLNKVDANKYIIKNNILHNKPRVLLYFVDTTTVEYIFNTHEEALAFHSDVLDKTKLRNKFIK